MKNMLFRILGALASALIIISVFVPFTSTNLISLWEAYNSSNAMYLPIMIIVFGGIGVVFFSLNIKTEFAYMSTGAITFFVVMRTIDILNQSDFSRLGIGYYFLAAGAIITGIMAFLLNLKSKKIVIENKVIEQEQVINNEDRLYDDQIREQVVPIEPKYENNITIQPINNPSQYNETSINTIEEPEIEEPINSIPEPLPVVEPDINHEFNSINEEPIKQETNINVVQKEINTEPDSTINFRSNIDGFRTSNNQLFNNTSVNVQPSTVSVESNNSEFNATSNNLSSSYYNLEPNYTVNNTQTVNPVVSEFSNGYSTQSNYYINNPEIGTPENTTVSEFTNIQEPVAYSESNSSNETDIFGQPLNR